MSLSTALSLLTVSYSEVTGSYLSLFCSPEVQELDCNGTGCPSTDQQESLCPADSYIAVSNAGDIHASERLLQGPSLPLFPSSSSSSAAAHAGSGHGKDDFSSTNIYTSDAEVEDYNDHNSNSLDLLRLTNDDEDVGDFIKSNNNEFHGNDIQTDSGFHEGMGGEEYIDYHEESDYLTAEMPTSFCVCNFSHCQIPDCPEGLSPAVVRNGTGIPGSCCDTYECKVVDGEYSIGSYYALVYTILCLTHVSQALWSAASLVHCASLMLILNLAKQILVFSWLEHVIVLWFAIVSGEACRLFIIGSRYLSAPGT